MSKKLPLEEFKQIYSKVPRFCVDLVIKSSQGILLTKRDISPDQGWWHFPGGTVLMGEMLEQTIQRVALEELNTKVTIKKLLGLLEYTESGFGFTKSAVYLVDPFSTELKGGEQAREIGYFQTLPEKTLPEVKRFLEESASLI